MTELDYLNLCIYEEARGEPKDGQAAVARVVLNRTALRYASDGTIAGTVLWPNQFSWAWFSFEGGAYKRVCATRADAEARASKLLVQAQATPEWVSCAEIAQAALSGSYCGQAANLGGDVVNYLNPAILKTLPAWANPALRVAEIGHHVFFRRA